MHGAVARGGCGRRAGGSRRSRRAHGSGGVWGLACGREIGSVAEVSRRAGLRACDRGGCGGQGQGQSTIPLNS
jgi:hypothetical protein